VQLHNLMAFQHQLVLTGLLQQVQLFFFRNNLVRCMPS
jgi:hypothetical protein